MIFSIFNSQYSIVNFLRTLRTEHWVFLAGLMALGYWLLRTSLGVRALTGSRPRRNNMPPYLPLVPMFIWFGPVPMVALLVRKLIFDSQVGNPGWQAAFLDNCVFVAGGLVTASMIVLLARAHFARRLKGFGLNVRTIPADVVCALANLLAIWPLVIGAVYLTMRVAQQIWGQDYQMQKHQELQLIAEYSQLPLRITVVVAAVVVAPLLEELLFRGLVQTMMRSALEGLKFEIGESRFLACGPAWLAIAASSALFTLMHADPGHWPALFVLGMGLGYSYEKSGSLFRPILVHSFFNAAMVAAAISQS